VVHVLGFLTKANRLDLITQKFTHPVPHSVVFEERKGRTHFDAVVRDRNGGIFATIESKFTERGFGTCLYPNGTTPRCDGTWWDRPKTVRGCPMATAARNRPTADRYWDTLHDFFGVPTLPPRQPVTCPLWGSYQLVHNLAETQRLDKAATWILLYDDRNPYFTDARVGWAHCLPQVNPRRIWLLSWQRLLEKAVILIPELNQVRRIHGF